MWGKATEVVDGYQQEAFHSGYLHVSDLRDVSRDGRSAAEKIAALINGVHGLALEKHPWTRTRCRCTRRASFTRSSTPARSRGRGRPRSSIAAVRLDLVEFPADDHSGPPVLVGPAWRGARAAHREEGAGWQTRTGDTTVGIHARGPGPGDTWSLPYFTVSDAWRRPWRGSRSLAARSCTPATACRSARDSEGTPFALALSDG